MCFGQAMVGWARVGGGCSREPRLMGSWGLRSRRGSSPRQVAMGPGVTMKYWQVVQRDLAGQREVGELCGEGKRKP